VLSTGGTANITTRAVHEPHGFSAIEADVLRVLKCEASEQPMTSRNLAVYGTCGAILVACLAAANMPSQDAEIGPPRAVRAPRVEPDAIAADVRSQAARLHTQMAEAPRPSAAVRNPFAFGEALRTQHAPATGPGPAVAADPVSSVAPAPSLLLMGIAEDTTASGPHRTAIIGGEGDAIYMVVEGDSVAARYRVTKIGPDAVELEDQTTKAYRRLALR